MSSVSVCESCRAAGSLAPLIREPGLRSPLIVDEYGPVSPEQLREDAVRLHAQCPGGSRCDCQCIVPEVPLATADTG